MWKAPFSASVSANNGACQESSALWYSKYSIQWQNEESQYVEGKKVISLAGVAGVADKNKIQKYSGKK